LQQTKWYQDISSPVAKMVHTCTEP
jgi:hypothetical protein